MSIPPVLCKYTLNAVAVLPVPLDHGWLCTHSGLHSCWSLPAVVLEEGSQSEKVRLQASASRGPTDIYAESGLLKLCSSSKSQTHLSSVAYGAAAHAHAGVEFFQARAR